MGTHEPQCRDERLVAGIMETINLMTWTSEKPQQPGWYWYREETWTAINSVSGGFFVYPDGRHVSEMNGEWAGPLEPPI
jgi:hypothetical protein